MELRLESTKAVHQLRADGAGIVTAARDAGLDAAVPSCPGWSMTDLLDHLTGIYVGREVVVREGLQERPSGAERPAGDPVEAFEAALAALVATLRSSDLSRQVWTFVGPRPGTWWSRRMAQETVIHRADAELAAGRTPPRVDAIVAIDGIDEMLTVFVAEALTRYGPPVNGGGPIGGSGQSVAVHTPDERWLVTLHDAEVQVERGSSANGDALIAGTPSHVLYHLWGRLPADEVDVRGDEGALAVLRRALRTAAGG